MAILESELSSRLPDEETQAAIDYYNHTLKAILEPAHNRETVAIHAPSGDYELARNSSDASRAVRAKHPVGAIVTMLVGPDQRDALAVRLLGDKAASGSRE